MGISENGRSYKSYFITPLLWIDTSKNGSLLEHSKKQSRSKLYEQTKGKTGGR